MIWWAAVIMLLVALLIVLLPLWRKYQAVPVLDTNTANVAMLKQQLAELEQEREAGTLAEDRYQQAVEELKASVAADLTSEPETTMKPLTSRHRSIVSLMVVLVLVIGSIVFYQQVTTYRELVDHPPVDNPAQAPTDQPTAEQVVEMLAGHLRESPDDSRAWQMLGKTYLALQRMPEAVSAFEKAVTLTEQKDAEVLVDYAEALGYANEGIMVGQPAEVLEQALAVDPGYSKGLWLKGFVYFQADDFASAVTTWEQVVKDPSISDESRTMLQQYIREAREIGGLPAPKVEPVAGVSVTVQVTLNPELADKVAAEDALFVFARATEGMPAPLAVKRLTVADLPVTVTLDESMAMIPSHSLAGKTEIILGARISKGNTPIAQPGDVQGMSSAVTLPVEQPIRVQIDQVVQ